MKNLTKNLTPSEPRPFRLGNETVGKLILIAAGVATEGNTGRVGVSKFVFAKDSGRIEVFFVEISTCLYYDEVFAGESVFPYPYMTDVGCGLFECIDSSYLDRIRGDLWYSGGLYSKHRHFVYFDDVFCWHITARDIEIRTTD